MVQPRKDMLNNKTVVQLRGIAKAIGNNKIKGYYRMRKPELVREIHKNTRYVNGELRIFTNKRL